MKRIISLIMAVLMLCALCVPAMAENTVTVVTPTKNSNGNYVIVLIEPGNYIIKEDCKVYKLHVKCGTLTIAEGVTVTVTSDVGNMGGVLNIGSGAVLDLSGANFNNVGTTNVYGAVNVAAKSFANNGTINVHGTVDIGQCNMCSNMPFGTINIYTDGSIIGSEKIMNDGTIIDGLDCQEDHTVCNHAFADNYICTKCGYVNAELHEHDYTTGFMTGRCACGAECPHTELDNGYCTVCDFFDPSQHTHDFTSGICKCGKTVCDVNGHTLNNGFCTVCDYFDPSQHTHVFTSGTCKCGKACPHENWTGGVCDTCHYACPHEKGFATGKCEDCGIECPHEKTVTKTFCAECNAEIENATASTLSEGSMTVVCTVAGIAVGFLAAMLIFKKKKPEERVES